MTTPSDSDASPKNIRPFAASPTAKGPVKPAQDGPKGAPPVKPAGPQPQPGPQTGPNKGQRQPSGPKQGQGPAKPGPNAGQNAAPNSKPVQPRPDPTLAASLAAKGPVKPAQDGTKGAPPVKPAGPQPQPGPQPGPNKGQGQPQGQPSGSNQGQGPAKPGPNAGPKAVPPRPGPVPGGPGPIAAAPKPVPAPKPPQPAQIPAPAVTPDAILAPPARPARMRGRHWGIIFSFLLFVLVPIGIAGWYLYERAADQFASTVGFSVRQEEGASGIELLAGLSAVGSSSSTDADILYEFIQSQKLVADIDAQIDLASMWSIAHETDPFFGYDPDGTIEDLLNHWERKVRIFYDSGTGLIEVRALAFTAQDANAISRAIFDESSAMINALSDIARADSIGYARAELEVAEGRLRDARGAVTDYRNRNQIVDPSADLQNQAGLIGNLQAQLAEALIEVDLLTETTQLGDPRIEQSQLRVRVIEDRINEERRKMGIGDGTGEGTAFADLVGEFERLSVEREFAESTYIATLASFDAAQAEARRQTRYLAAHVQPTLAQRAEFPQRLMVLGLIALFIFVIWSILVLVYYSLKDRR